VRIHENIRSGLRERLWLLADELNWSQLNWYEKSNYYETWTLDPEVGGLLANYMDQRRIRVYVKDTIMKGYVRSRQADPRTPLEALGIELDAESVATYERPHGRRLADGRVIVWGNAEDWKLVLTAVHERSYDAPGASTFAAVLMASNGKYSQPAAREMVQDAADKLGIKHLVWLG